MENTKKQVGGSSSSFAMELFGPKDSPLSSSSTGLFASVFAQPSMGLQRDSSHSGTKGSSEKQDLGSQHSNAKHETPDNTTQRSKAVNGSIYSEDRSSNYYNETVEPCYLSSSIYYGGQEVYSSRSQTSGSQHSLKKDGGYDGRPIGGNSNSASRGNWWQESLYY